MSEMHGEYIQHKDWVDRGGYNVPVHLVGLVDEYEIPPDEVCAIADLFESTEDYEKMRDNRLAFIGGRVSEYDPRIDEVSARWARLQEQRTTDRSE